MEETELRGQGVSLLLVPKARAKQSLSEVREKSREAFMKKNHPKAQLLTMCPPTMKPHSSAHGAGSGWEKMKRNCSWLKGREGFRPSDIDKIATTG